MSAALSRAFSPDFFRDYFKFACGRDQAFQGMSEAFDDQGVVLLHSLKKALKSQLGEEYRSVDPMIRDLEREFHQVGEGSPKFVSLLYQIEDLLDSVACA